jgi:hypothetical protein
MADAALEGGCLCGNIRFRVTAPPERPHSCSCRMCQRHTGSLTALWVELPADRVQWCGPGRAPAVWRASAQSSRAFCPVCGSSIGALDDAPVVALLTGTFDDPGSDALRPRAHSHKSGRPHWWKPAVAGAKGPAGRG